MRKILDQKFEINGATFCICSNNNKLEYEGRYKLLIYNDRFKSWMIKSTDDSMKNLKKYAEENVMYW